MNKSITLKSGQQVGHWRIFHPIKRGNRGAFVCQCECGTIRIVLAQSLKAGSSLSCGCHSAKAGAEKRTRHGNAKRGMHTKEFTAWSSMRDRCTNPKNNSYPNYGARGIRICDRWMCFENFLADMGKAPSQKHTLERIDNDGNYSPSNCKWATRAEQNVNKRGAGIRNTKGQFIGTKTQETEQ